MLVKDLVEIIDEFLLKDKIYIQPERGDKPPKGAQIKEGPKGGKFYESKKEVQAVNPDLLRRQYAAFKTRQSNKLTPEQKKFVLDTLGKLNKLNDEELKTYFSEQYGSRRKVDWNKFQDTFDKYDKNIDILNFMELEKYLNKIKNTSDYALLFKVGKELITKFKPENPRILRWYGHIVEGIRRYKNTGSTQLLEYVAKKVKDLYLIWSGIDIPDKKEEIAKFLVGNPWSESYLLKKISYFKKYPEDSKENYKRFVLALKPYKSDIPSVDVSKYQIPIYNAFIKRDWDKAENKIKTTKYGIARTQKELEKL